MRQPSRIFHYTLGFSFLAVSLSALTPDPGQKQNLARYLRPASAFAMDGDDLGIDTEPTSDPAERLRPVHERLFSCFLPRQILAQDATLQNLAHQAEEEIWAFIKTRSDILGLLKILRLDPYLYSDLDSSCSAHILRMMKSPFEQQAKAIKGIRALYLSFIYDGPFGNAISGEKNSVPVVHPELDQYLAQFRTQVIDQLPKGQLKYNLKEKKLNLKFDYIVIGSGPAGSVLGHELRRGGKKVLLIERGPFVVPGAVDTVRSSGYLESNNLRTTQNGGIVIRNAEALGGGTSVNIDLAFSPLMPSVQKQINSWRKKGWIKPQQWTPEELEPAYDWVKEHVGTRKLDYVEINKNNEILWSGATVCGFDPQLYDLNHDEMKCLRSPVTGKRSAVSGLLLEAMTDTENPLFVLADTEVLKLNRSGSRVSSVQVRKNAFKNLVGTWNDPYLLQIPDNEVFEVEAEKVILSAGALGSATLLLKSGLSELNPEIGKGVILHPSMPVIGQFAKDINIQEGLSASVYVSHFATDPKHGYMLEAMSAGPGYGAIMLHMESKKLLTTLKDFNHFGGFGVMLIDRSSPQNHIELDEKGNPVIVYQLSSSDQERMRKGIKTALDVLFNAGAIQVAIPTLEYLDESEMPGTGQPSLWKKLKQSFSRKPVTVFYSDIHRAKAAVDRLQFDPLQTILTSAHMQATNGMGRVIDSDHKFIGLDNLFVVDSSAFPESIGANPMQSIYTQAKIFADHQLSPKE